LLILRYNDRIFRASKDFIFIIKLSIFIATFCRKIQREQEKYNRLIVFFAISSILINSTISRFREKNLESLTTNKEQQIEVSILTNIFVQN